MILPFNKRKIINDPVHGFISIQSELIYDLINHPYFQRLRRIKQLGMAEFVYPGALHTRFHHALGAMHLMEVALNTIKQKGTVITDEEWEAAQIAILLHDIGHGPMSHALEATILNGIAHEKISLMFMMELNQIFKGKLDLAVQIFSDTYHRRFFHQLVASQLDIDRLDYLQRDCFFTGVSEGIIGGDRILKMLTVHEDKLTVEEKGIYSIENFLTARRLMYWQVYFHKTNISADRMLIQIIKRAKYLARKNNEIPSTSNLAFFLTQKATLQDFYEHPEYLQAFATLDDYDIWGAIKMWVNHKDKVLSTLSRNLLNRHLFKVKITEEKVSKNFLKEKEEKILKKLNLKQKDVKYFLLNGVISNEAYLSKKDKINILTKKGEILDIAQASDLPNIKALRKIVKKYYVCWLTY